MCCCDRDRVGPRSNINNLQATLRMRNKWSLIPLVKNLARNGVTLRAFLKIDCCSPSVDCEERMRAMAKDCALDQVELEMLCHEFSDEALEIQADPKRDQPMRNTTLYYMHCTAVFFCPGP